MAEGPTIILTGGGTGGHVYPGLAVAAALRGHPKEGQSACARLLYVGSTHGLERDLVARAGLPFAGIWSGALRGRGRLAQLASVSRLLGGIAQALAIIRRTKPSAILATGGYVSAPVVLAGWLARVPSVIYLPDVEPGMAVRYLSRFAQRVCVTSEHSRRFLPAKKVVVTGYPLRPELLAIDRGQARSQLALAPDERVLLVLGGSRGAHSLNTALTQMLDELLPETVVCHVCGREDEPSLREVASTLPDGLRARYRLAAYLHDDLAPTMAAADLAVSRAGASVMGEYPLFRLPSVLVPYPHAGAHQARNADYLVEMGAAVELPDAELSDGGLLPVVRGLLGDPARLTAMGDAAHRLVRPNAAKAIAEEISVLCSKG